MRDKDRDRIDITIDVDMIDPDMLHEGATATSIDFFAKPSSGALFGYTHEVFQKIPKVKRTLDTRPIRCGWAKITPMEEVERLKKTPTWTT